MKVSIVIPVYYNEDNLRPLYDDLKKKVIDVIDYDYEIVMVNDGSGDASYEVMKELASKDPNIKIYSLSRNYGSHAAVMCGFSKCTGDCAVIKAADLQEPSELILEMVNSWKKGNNVVLACRDGREEGKRQVFFSNLYYKIVRKTALPNMPKNGFDVCLIDRKVIEVLDRLDEKNSSFSCQILWSGFKTDYVHYVRKAREIGKSRWTLKKKIRLVTDTLFSFSTVPIKILSIVGVISIVGSVSWALYLMIMKMLGKIEVDGWTSLFVFNLLSFGILMLAMGVMGEYLWRSFDASRNRPLYIVEEDGQEDNDRR